MDDMTSTTPTVPFTLRSAGGLPDHYGPLADGVLVVIDAQAEYGPQGGLALDGIDGAAANIARLLEGARTGGAPVIHIVQQGRPGGLFDPTEGGAVLDEAAAAPGEIVVVKATPSGFAGTDLSDRLEVTGRRHLVLAGFMTHMCVSTTARRAIDYGFEVTVVADATATRPLPDAGNGQVIPAATVHRTALAALADRFAVATTTASLLPATT